MTIASTPHTASTHHTTMIQTGSFFMASYRAARVWMDESSAWAAELLTKYKTIQQTIIAAAASPAESHSGKRKAFALFSVEDSGRLSGGDKAEETRILVLRILRPRSSMIAMRSPGLNILYLPSNPSARQRKNTSRTCFLFSGVSSSF